MATRTGSRGNNNLTGTNQDDTILGLGGADTINALGGNDFIVAGPGGSDTINGGTGEDTLVLDGAFADYSVSFMGANVLFKIGAVVETVTGVELVAFDDKVLRIVGAGSQTTTIQAAVDAADMVDPNQATQPPPDSILVAPGDYTSEGRILIADKNVEILGANFGSPPAVNTMIPTVIDGIDLVGSASLTLDGVTLTGQTQPSGNGVSGILAASSGSVTVLNSQISASQAPDTNGIGIDVSSGTGNVTVDNVAFTGFTGLSTVSSYGVYLNFAANTVRDVSITNSDFDLRADGDSDLRSYGVVFDSYGAGSGSLNVSGNTFNNSTWGLGVFDFAGALSGAPDYSGITGNTFTNTNEAAGNIRNGTDYVITTGSNVSNGVTYDRFLVGTGDSLSSASGDDVLTGNDGNELIAGNAGNDQITGGRGNDKIYGGDGNDTANVDVSTDGADNVDLGSGLDTVNAGGAAQIRVTFTSAEVGNGNVNDGGVLANNQDGGLAVRLQAEDGTGALTGQVGRYDDEGITFFATGGSKFDVRDLVSGTQRGDQFDAVALGTSGADTITLAGIINYYANGGAGNDTITTGTGNDFLVGGIGNDTLTGGAGNDNFIGGAGTDQVVLAGSFGSYSVSFMGASVLFTIGPDVKNVTGAEFVAFDDKLLRIVGAGSETTSIQSAVNAAATNSAQPESILVAPGDYSSEGRILIADKNVEILGANFGSPPAVNTMIPTVIDGIDLVGSASLTLDGVTLTGQTQPSGNGVSGILAASSGSVTVLNSQISASQAPDTNGIGIDVSSGTGNVTVDNVAFTGFTGYPQ